MPTSKAIQNTPRLWTEEGETSVGTIATVAPLLRFAKNYSYTVPKNLESEITLGKRVMVPVGKKARLIEGFVIAIGKGQWDSTLRRIESVTDTQSFLTNDLIELAKEISDHYRCPLGQTLRAMTPQAVRKEAGLRKVRYIRLAKPIEQIKTANARISTQRQKVLDILSSTVSTDFQPQQFIQEASGVSSSIIRSMQKDAWIEIQIRKEIPETSEQDNEVTDPDFALNDEQQNALTEIKKAIDAQTFSANLLFGVSGSGKTEVYVHAMRQVIAQGKQAIMLVPEIVLTTQLVQRLAQRFERVAVVHSGLTSVQRSLMWRAIAAGKKDVVIGTRSAVFAPTPNLGIICVDEEQETSYKNLQAPRFHVRDVAIIRASKRRIPVVLGSATPSLETWYNSQNKPNYQRLTITSRVKDLPMPKVQVVDMEEEQAEIKAQLALSRIMEQSIAESLEKKEQALLLVNRRGFARQLFCPSCKTTHRCPNCDIPFVIHATTNKAVCHYCNKSENTPTHCQSVSCNEELIQSGQGTQRIEWILNETFPGARVERVDSDTMTHRDDYEKIVTRFANREIDILVGTQMIAKGLDFPFVSFVGMVDADASAIAHDFRANERLFQLVTQVAGRAGRADATGQVVVQTKNPNLPAFTHALNHDYVAFSEEEIKARKKSHWPPFRRIARIVLTHQREQTAEQEATALSQRIAEAINEIKLTYADVLPAAPCAIARIKGRYRYDVIIRTHTASDLRKLFTHLESKGSLRTKAQSQTIDIDPVAMT